MVRGVAGSVRLEVRTGVRREDINCNLPLDRLREMEEAGEIGSLSPETQVVMGLQPNVTPLIQSLVPELVSRFKSDSVEAALLVPS